MKNEKKDDPHQQLFWRKLEESAARVGDYKTIRLKDFETVMYNLDQNLEETENLSKIEKDKFKELENDFFRMGKEFNPAFMG